MITADAKSTVKFIYEEILCRFGPPNFITTDQGTHFTADVIRQLIEMVQTIHRLTIPYNPQSNAIDERANQTIIQSLSKYVADHPEQWEMYLPAVIWSYNNKIHHMTGMEPYKLLFGRKCRTDVFI